MARRRSLLGGFELRCAGTDVATAAVAILVALNLVLLASLVA
jgi:hypothetical protein